MVPDKSKKVLIIDDEAFVRNLIKKYLEQLGYETIEAENGLEGVNIYQENKDKISFIILDVNMPVMDGEQALKELVKINPDANIIVISRFPDPGKIQAIKSIKDVKMLRKPYQVGDLEKAMDF